MSSTPLVNALRSLGLISRRAKTRVLLEPFVIEAAVARLDQRGRRLTLPEQVIVFRATRTPHKVHWPQWWEYRG